MNLHVNGTTLFVRTLGDGPLGILTLHGGLGLDHTTLAPWLDPLAAHGTLVYYDQRGNGRSARSSVEAVDNAVWAEDAEALREHLGLDRVVVFAHSYAAAIAVEYARAFPERLAGLALCAPLLSPDSMPFAMTNLQERANAPMLQAARRYMAHPEPGDEDFATMWRAVQPVYFHDPQQAEAAGYGQDIVFSAAANVRSMRELLPGLDGVDAVAEIEAPILLLAGAHDWLLPVDHSLHRLHRRAPRSQGVVFEDSGHFPFVEEHELAVRHLTDWLARAR